MRATVSLMLISFLLFCTAGFAQPKPTTAPVTNGLVLWLKADKGLKTDGSKWNDQSGQGHDATARPGQAPEYVPQAFNGLPVARFKGAQTMAIAGKVVSSQQFTIITVVTDASAVGYSHDRDIIGNWDTAFGPSIFNGTVWRQTSGIWRDRIRFTDSVGGGDQGQTGVGELKHPKTLFILSCISRNKNAIVRVGRRNEYKLGTALPKFDLDSAWTLGRSGPDPINDNFWIGDIAEVLVYDEALSNTDLEADIAYLQRKWK